MNKKIQFFLFFLVITFVIFIVIFTNKNVVNISGNNVLQKNTNVEIKNNKLSEETQDSIMSFALTGNNIVLPVGSTSNELQVAIVNSNPGDIITISDNVVYETSGRIIITEDKEITIQSDEGNNWSLLNNGGSRHFDVYGTLTLQNIILEGNHLGGGIEVWHEGTLNMNDGTIIQNCIAPYGGGVNNYGVLNMYGGKIINNDGGDYGGGVYQQNIFNMYNGSIEGNSAISGGGIYNSAVHTGQASESVIFNMYGGNISKNSSVGGGGGIHANTSTVNINSISESCYISDNQTKQLGGGIYAEVATINIAGTNNISNNTSDLSGGGICLILSKLNITGTNSILNNTAKGDGGGIYVDELSNSNIITDSSTIFDGNIASVAYKPPSNAKMLYPNIGFASTSITNHPLNNYDINYKGDELLFNVSYDANGGIGGYKGPDIIPGSSDTVLSLVETGISRYKYIFNSWNTKSDGSGTRYSPKDNIILNDDTTLYAQWVTEECIVTFDSNGGTPVNEQRVTFDVRVTKPEDPTKQGYTFGGWYTDNVTFLNEWDFNNSVEESMILYAKWLANNYVVTFDSNGGTQVDNQVVPEGDLIIKPTDPTKRGYIFDGWYTDNEIFLNEWDFNSPVTGEIILYAKWKVDISYILIWIVIVSFITLLAMMICYEKTKNIKKCSNKQKPKRCGK